MNKEAEWLLKEKYSGEKTEGFFTDCKRLEAGEPLAYVIGHIPFLGCTIYLDSHPLIPRPETEFWVEKAIEHIKSAGPKTPRVLDLCAGSGCIGVAIAKLIPETHVTFGEIDQAHLPTIAKNLKENDIECTRYQVFESDLFLNIEGTFDVILSNPPYIDPTLDRAEASVKDFEPHEALYGGEDGLFVINRVLRDTKNHLSQNGELWLEHEPEQVRRLNALAKEHGLTIATHTDQYNAPRYSVFAVAQ